MDSWLGLKVWSVAVEYGQMSWDEICALDQQFRGLASNQPQPFLLQHLIGYWLPVLPLLASWKTASPSRLSQLWIEVTLKLFIFTDWMMGNEKVCLGQQVCA